MDYKITVLKGDGIGPEVIDQTLALVKLAGQKYGHGFIFHEELMGGCAIDATGVPLPQRTVESCKASDAVLLGAVGGPKWGHPSRQSPPGGRPSGHSGSSRAFCKSPAGRHI